MARFGGDEFLILCELDEQSEVYPIANRLLESLRRPFEIGTEEVFLGASAGIAMYDPRIGSDVGTLIRNADVALYRAKEKGARATKCSMQASTRDRNSGSRPRPHCVTPSIATSSSPSTSRSSASRPTVTSARRP